MYCWGSEMKEPRGLRNKVTTLVIQLDWLACIIGTTGFIINTRQVTRATHVRNRICPRVKLIIKIIIILLIIFLGFIKSKSC